MIKTEMHEYDRGEKVMVVSQACVCREAFLKLLKDNGFEASEGCKWSIVDDQKSIVIKSSGEVDKPKRKAKPKSVIDELDDCDLESDC